MTREEFESILEEVFEEGYKQALDDIEQEITNEEADEMLDFDLESEYDSYTEGQEGYYSFNKKLNNPITGKILGTNPKADGTDKFRYAQSDKAMKLMGKKDDFKKRRKEFLAKENQEFEDDYDYYDEGIDVRNKMRRVLNNVPGKSAVLGLKGKVARTGSNFQHGLKSYKAKVLSKARNAGSAYDKNKQLIKKKFNRLLAKRSI